MFGFFKIKISSKQITYGAIFSAMSTAIILILVSYTPIIVYPTFRISIEGVLIKISGYLLGMTIGTFVGAITELLIALIRPVSFHWAYLISIMLYGFLAGLVRYLRFDTKKPRWILSLISLIIVIGFLFFGVFFMIPRIASANNIADQTWLVRHMLADKDLANYVFIAIQCSIIGLFLAGWMFCWYYKKGKFNDFWKDILPIFVLAILTEYFVSIGISPFGDTKLTQIPYNFVVIGRILESPIQVIGNTLIIYLVWKVLNGIIRKKVSKGYSVDSVISTENKPFYNTLLKSNISPTSPINSLITMPIKKNLSINWAYSASVKAEYFYKMFPKLETNKTKVIYVTGTNGKGSTCMFLANILREQGLRVGLFQSPHLYNWTERITVDGKEISVRDLNLLHTEIFSRLKKDYNYTIYDELYFTSLLYFYNEKVDVIVMEAGIGAKKDIGNHTRNIVSGAITSVSKDHENILGYSLKQILDQKKYAIHPNSYNPVFIDPTTRFYSWYKTIVRRFAKRKNAEVEFVSDYIKIDKDVKNVTKFIYKNQSFSIPLPSYQASNSIIAMLLAKNYLKLKKIPDNWLNIIKNTYLPGRWEHLEIANFNIIIDVAHNSDGILSFVEEIKRKEPNESEYCVLCGINKKKDIALIGSIIEQNIKNFAFAALENNSLIAKSYDYPIHLQKYFIENSHDFLEKNKQKRIYITGSFQFVSEIIQEIIIHNSLDETQFTKKVTLASEHK